MLEVVSTVRRVIDEVIAGVRAIGIWVELLGMASAGGEPEPRPWIVARGTVAMVLLFLAGRADEAAAWAWRTAWARG